MNPQKGNNKFINLGLPLPSQIFKLIHALATEGTRLHRP